MAMSNPVRRRSWRRNFMFWLTAALLGACVLGSTILKADLAKPPIRFLVYWSLVALSAILLVILAVYDLLQVTRPLRKA
jgi:hypothetical protein